MQGDELFTTLVSGPFHRGQNAGCCREDALVVDFDVSLNRRLAQTLLAC